MKIVLDTHAWIWWVADPKRLSGAAAEAIETAASIGVAAISCWEVAMLVRKERLALDRPVDRWVRQALAREGVQAQALGPQVATAAGMLDSAEFPGDPADRFIYATARASGSTLVTRDRVLRDYDPRGTLW